MGPREFQLLLCCARSEADARSVRDFVNAGVDWQTLLELAQQHGVRPMLLRSLKCICWDAVPQTSRLALEHFNRTNLHKNLLLTGELLRLSGEFQRNGIQFAALKGAVLAQSVYGDLSLREFCDLDLLIHETDIDSAEDLLTAWEYQAQFPDRDYRNAFLSYQGQYAFIHRHTGIVVDLHWRLSSKGITFPLHSAEVWPRLGNVIIAGRTIPTLAQDDLVLFLAAHGTKEGWRSLNWVCDFAEFVRNSQDIDWAAIFDRAHRSHSSRPLLLAILLASTLLDARAPKELIDKAHDDPVVRALAEEARLRMLRTAPRGELGEFLDSLKTHDRLGRRLWPVATLLTTRTVGDHHAMPLPKPFWGIYYLTRPFRLARKVLKMILQES